MLVSIKLESSYVQAESTGSGGRSSDPDYRAGKHAQEAAADIVRELTSARSDSPPPLRMPIPVRAAPLRADFLEPFVPLMLLDGADRAEDGEHGTAETQNSCRADIADSDYVGSGLE